MLDLESGFAYDTTFGAFALTPDIDSQRDADGRVFAQGVGVNANWQMQWEALDRSFDVQLLQNNWMTFDGPLSSDQGLLVDARVGSLFTLPSTGLVADMDVGHRVVDLNDAVPGETHARITLRNPLGPLWTARTNLGLLQRGFFEDGAVDRLGRFGLSLGGSTGPDDLGISLRQQLDLGMSGLAERQLVSEVDLVLGRHRLGLRQGMRLDRLGNDPTAHAGLSYGWESGLVDLSLTADYSIATAGAPAQVFGGFAVTIGGGTASAADVLASLR